MDELIGLELYLNYFCFKVAQRISEAAGVKEKEDSPPKSGKKAPKAKAKAKGKAKAKAKTPNRRKIVKNDSSSDDEMAVDTVEKETDDEDGKWNWIYPPTY